LQAGIAISPHLKRSRSRHSNPETSQRGSTYSLTGDKAYQDFFALWKDADADTPNLKEAKAEYEKLK
jgi:hypothetical protein